jgi:hypothetical protein
MSGAQNPVHTGRLSPDGRWRWDGMTWVPVVPALTSGMARRRKLMVWWLTSTSSLLVVLVAVAAVLAYQQIQSGRTGLGCLPYDFPTFPKATVLEVDQTFEMPMQGDTGRCRMRLSSSEGLDSVNSFFRQRLNSGDWMYSEYLEDPSGAITYFQLKSRALTRGVVTVHKLPVGTTFEIELFS